jgi:hypothetical protein
MVALIAKSTSIDYGNGHTRVGVAGDMVVLCPFCLGDLLHALTALGLSAATPATSFDGDRSHFANPIPVRCETSVERFVRATKPLRRTEV